MTVTFWPSAFNTADTCDPSMVWTWVVQVYGTGRGGAFWPPQNGKVCALTLPPAATARQPRTATEAAATAARCPSPDQRAARRAEQRDVAIATVQRYNPQAVVVVGVPFGHTRPQWILPYGGSLTIDNTTQRMWVDYT